MGRCPFVADMEISSRRTENLYPDLAGPNPKRRLPPVHLENQRAHGAIARLLRRAGSRHYIENRLRQAC